MNFKIAIAQIHPVIGDIRRNLETHISFINKAIEAEAQLIIFPELSLTGYSLMDLTSEVAITPDASILEPLLKLSEKISICLGAVEESPEYFYFNSSFFLEGGQLINVYRKIYPPSYGVFDEKRFFAQGKQVRAFQSKLGEFGILICNDARHPALAYLLAMDGCKFLIIQSAVPARGFPAHDKPLPIKYFRNGCVFYSSVFGIYTIFANLCGHENGLLFGGNSLITEPGGKVIAEAPLFEEAFITAEISHDKIRQFRTATPIMNEENIDITIAELNRIKNKS